MGELIEDILGIICHLLTCVPHISLGRGQWSIQSCQDLLPERGPSVSVSQGGEGWHCSHAGVPLVPFKSSCSNRPPGDPRPWQGWLMAGGLLGGGVLAFGGFEGELEQGGFGTWEDL